jgi:pyruvate kinase
VTSERRVKIVTTLGPAVAGKDKLVDLISAGADMVRVNAAHGSEEERARLIEDVRSASQEVGKYVPILFDLRGLKIRTGPLSNGSPVPFARGSDVRIVPQPEPTREGLIGINLPQLLSVIKPGSRILIADGLIELLVDRIEGQSAICKVGRGGVLHGKQGVTLPGAAIVGGSLTPDDRVDVAFAVNHGVDYLGLSFINDASDLVLAKGVAGAHGQAVPGLIAKIERPEALTNVDDIASQADGLMVARGLQHAWGTRHHRDPDARIDDHAADGDARRDERRRQRGLGRNRRGHALG